CVSLPTGSAGQEVVSDFDAFRSSALADPRRGDLHAGVDRAFVHSRVVELASLRETFHQVEGSICASSRSGSGTRSHSGRGSRKRSGPGLTQTLGIPNITTPRSIRKTSQELKFSGS